MFTSCECLFHSREEWEDCRGLGVDQIKKICQICRDRLNVVHLSTNITFKENGVPLKKILSLKLKNVVTHSVRLYYTLQLYRLFTKAVIPYS